MSKEYEKEWDESYKQGGNICFYPHEEIIRFMNKYIRKRRDINEYQYLVDKEKFNKQKMKGLDLGCGIGRHVKYLDECGLEVYGIDISEYAIEKGKEWFRFINREDLSERLLIGSVTDLPFEDEIFDVCVSHGVLDSMQKEIAQEGFAEAFRVLKTGAFMYFDVVLALDGKEQEVLQQEGLEKNTVQFYYTVDTIKELLGNKWEIVDLKIVSWSDEFENNWNKRGHVVVKKK